MLAAGLTEHVHLTGVGTSLRYWNWTNTWLRSTRCSRTRPRYVLGTRPPAAAVHADPRRTLVPYLPCRTCARYQQNGPPRTTSCNLPTANSCGRVAVRCAHSGAAARRDVMPGLIRVARFALGAVCVAVVLCCCSYTTDSICPAASKGQTMPTFAAVEVCLKRSPDRRPHGPKDLQRYAAKAYEEAV